MLKIFKKRRNIFLQRIQEQTNLTLEGVDLLLAYMNNPDTKIADQLTAKEKEADEARRLLIDELNRTFITPFDREDIYRLVHRLDDIIDLIENAIHSVYLYNLDQKKYFFDEFATFSREATEKLNQLIAECFRAQKYTPLIGELIRSLHDLEDKGDLVYAESLQKLFSEEKDPVNIIKWKDVLFVLETIMDVYQAVSNTVEGIVVKSG